MSETEWLYDQFKEANEELQALRAWKEKARPFLEHSLERLSSYYMETDENNVLHDGIRESYKSKIKTLAELLGDE